MKGKGLSKGEDSYDVGHDAGKAPRLLAGEGFLIGCDFGEAGGMIVRKRFFRRMKRQGRDGIAGLGVG